MIDSDKLSELYRFLNQTINQKAVHGISYAVLSNDQRELFYLGKVGLDAQSLDVNPDMLYDLASLTKVVGTTTRMLQLLATKKINLTDSVSQYLPKFRFPKVTIQNLLLHNSGLPGDLLNVHQLTTRQALIKQVFAADLQSEPSSMTCYSDLGYILLGWIIESVDGISLQVSLNKNIFKPLEMFNTGYNLHRNKDLFVPTEIQAKRGGRIQGSVHDYKAFLLDGVSGHAGIFSTLRDLCHFTTMLLNSGIYKDKIIIPQEGMDLLTHKQVNGRSLGWLCDQTKAQYWHTGFTGTSIAFDLKHKQAFICLTNRIYPTRNNRKWIDARKRALAIFFNESSEKF